MRFETCYTVNFGVIICTCLRSLSMSHKKQVDVEGIGSVMQIQDKSNTHW